MLNNTIAISLRPQTYAYDGAFEHFVICEIMRQTSYLERNYQFFYLRAESGAEMDLIVERPGEPLVLIKIKFSERVDAADIRHIETFLPEFEHAIGVCLCHEPRPRRIGNVHILPWVRGIQEIVRPG